MKANHHFAAAITSNYVSIIPPSQILTIICDKIFLWALPAIIKRIWWSRFCVQESWNCIKFINFLLFLTQEPDGWNRRSRLNQNTKPWYYWWRAHAGRCRQSRLVTNTNTILLASLTAVCLFVVTPSLPRDGGTAWTAIQIHAVNLIEIRLGERWQPILNQSWVNGIPITDKAD